MKSLYYEHQLSFTMKVELTAITKASHLDSFEKDTEEDFGMSY